MYRSSVHVEKKATWSHVPWTAQGLFFFSLYVFEENLNASRPENPAVRGEMSKRLGGIIGCK